MSFEGHRFYPGETATPRQMLQLADEYRRGAEALASNGRRGQPLSRAPYRLLAIHAIELYLNALLLAVGRPPADVRALQHDLGSRAEAALAARLGLRMRTVAHLRRLSETREYLVTRYDPQGAAGSELNRLAATLAEVGGKVAVLVGRLAPEPPS